MNVWDGEGEFLSILSAGRQGNKNKMVRVCLFASTFLIFPFLLLCLALTVGHV